MNLKHLKNYGVIALIIGFFAACGVTGNGEDFDEFYAKFHEDSLFQIERTIFPLNGETSYLSPTGTQMKLWYADDWVMQRAYDPTDTLGYKQGMIDADTMIVDVIYDDKKQGVTRYFSLRDDKWYLTFYSDYNPINTVFIEDK